MKHFTISFFALFIIANLYAQGKWEPLTTLPPGPRERAFHFTFEDKLILGLGRSHRGYSDISINEKDVWSYEFATDTWQELDTFPGTPFRNAASFVIGDTAYIVTGHNGSDYVDFFWKYHPATDTWQELPPFPGGIQSFPVTFSIGGKGYVCLGGIGLDQPTNSVYYQNLWEYDPTTGNWTPRSDFPGEGRWRAFSFVIDGKAYVGGGSRDRESGLDLSDTYQYDPVSDHWTPVADFPEGWGLGTYSFSIDGRGYVGEGARHLYDENYRNKVWEYDPVADQWEHVSNLPGSQQGRILSYSATHAGKAYVGGGRNYSLGSFYSPFFDDFYVWDKNATVEVPDHEYWQSLGRGTTDSSMISIYAIDPIDENCIWALPAAKYTNSEAPLEIMKTSNGGNNWQTTVIDTTRGYSAVNIYALDSQTAWVMASFNETETVVYQTEDGGQHWVLKLDGMSNLIEESIGLHFFDSNTGLLWGNEWSNPRLVVYRTTDGGTSWEMVDDPNLPEPGSWLAGFAPSGNNMYDAVGDTIWIPTDIQILRSTDRGASWTATEFFPFSIYSLAFEDAQHGIFTSDNYFNTLRSRAFVTEDGGDTWVETNIPETPLAVSIEHLPGSPGAYVAHSTMFPSTKITYTPNNGMDWYEVEAPPTLHTLKFLSKDLGFGGGPILKDMLVGVYRWQGVFDEIITSTEPILSSGKLPYLISPNPVEDVITISNPEGHFINLIQLFDGQGKTLQQMLIGHNQEFFEVSLGNLPKGFYVIQIQDEHSGYSRKILKH